MRTRHKKQKRRVENVSVRQWPRELLTILVNAIQLLGYHKTQPEAHWRTFAKNSMAPIWKAKSTWPVTNHATKKEEEEEERFDEYDGNVFVLSSCVLSWPSKQTNKLLVRTECGGRCGYQSPGQTLDQTSCMRFIGHGCRRRCWFRYQTPMSGIGTFAFVLVNTNRVLVFQALLLLLLIGGCHVGNGLTLNANLIIIVGRGRGWQGRLWW